MMRGSSLISRVLGQWGFLRTKAIVARGRAVRTHRQICRFPKESAKGIAPLNAHFRHSELGQKFSGFNYLIVDLIYGRADRHLNGARLHMPDELIVILGAEASVLIFVTTMTLRAKRMDVLSGRFFERPVVSHASNSHSPQWVRGYAQDLSRFARMWISVAKIPAKLWQWLGQTGNVQSSLRTKLRIPSQLVAQWRRPGAPVADAPGRQAAFLGASRTPGARGYVAPAPSARALEASLAEVQRSLNARSA